MQSVPIICKQMNTKFLFSNWQTASSDDKTALLETILSHIGNNWKIDKGQLIHQPSGKQFAFIPGGWMTQGLSALKLYNLCIARNSINFEESSWPEDIEQLRPAKQVWVYPFLVSVEYENKKRETESEYGFSLPTESELEWLFSYGGQTDFVAEKIGPKKKKKKVGFDVKFDRPFTIENLENVSAQCIDDWHDTLHEKPDNSLPWGTGRAVAKDIHTLWQDIEEEVLSWHVSVRGGSSGERDHFDIIRLNELFPEIDNKPESESADFITDILENGKAGEKKALIGMCDLMSYTPADDTPAVLEKIFINLETDPKQKPKLLKVAAKIVCGPKLEERLTPQSPFTPARKELITIVDKYSSVLLQMLDISNTPATKASVAEILSVSSNSDVFDAYLNLYKEEKHATVLEALHISSAFYSKNNNIERLLFEEYENPKDKTPEYFKFIASSIVKGTDYEAFIQAIKEAGKIKEQHIPISVSLLSATGVEQEKLGHDLALLSYDLAKEIKKPENKQMQLYPLYELCEKAIHLAFQKETGKVEDNTPWLLLPENISQLQKEAFRAFKSFINYSQQSYRLQWLTDLRLPYAEFSWDILIGESDSVMGHEVIYNNTKMPIYWALYEIGKLDDKDVLSDFLSNLDNKEILDLYSQEKTYDDGLSIPYKSACADLIGSKYNEHKDAFKNHVTPQFNEYFSSKGERLKLYDIKEHLLNLTAYLIKDDKQLQSWFLEPLSINELNQLDMDFGDTKPISFFSESMIAEKLKSFEDLCSTLILEKYNSAYMNYGSYFFRYCFTPQSDLKYVMGLLAAEMVTYNYEVIGKLRSDDDYSHFYDAIPEEYFDDETKKIAFEKLWRVFTENKNFKV